MVKAVIDRFEESKAVLLFGENETKVIFPRKYLPVAAKEGDFLTIEIAYDEFATKAAKQEAEALLNKVKTSNI